MVTCRQDECNQVDRWAGRKVEKTRGRQVDWYTGTSYIDQLFYFICV